MAVRGLRAGLFWRVWGSAPQQEVGCGLAGIGPAYFRIDLCYLAVDRYL